MSTPVIRGIAIILLTGLAGCARATMPVAAIPSPASGYQHTLIPAPASFLARSGAPFIVTGDTRLVATDARAAATAAWLASLIAAAPSRAAAVEVMPRESALDALENAIIFDLASDAGLGNEGYRLVSNASRIVVTASQPAGLFYGAQTLRQLMPALVEHEWVQEKPLSVPSVEIEDAPRFAWRGMMLDVARHFFGVDEVKRVIDFMALYKMNRLHLHLSDDQGWRIEIPGWPNLTRHGASTEVGGGPGGFYTQADYADIVAYAASRHVAVIPEIDMPGHTNAALASYPELNCDGRAPALYTGIEVGFSTLCVDVETTYRFVEDVVREIGAMSPAGYFHVGGDEVKKLTHEQYTAFISRVEGIVRKHGLTMIGWDEIAAGTLHPSSIVQLWRYEGRKGDIAQTGKVIVSPANRAYIDMKYTPATPIGLAWAGHVEVRDAYDWDPAAYLDELTEAHVVGVEAPLWTETVARRADLDYLAFPRLAGLAEIGWTPRANRRWEDYRMRLAAQAPRWTALGINFYRSPQIPWTH